MNYLLAIKTAVIIFPILAAIVTGPFILHQYHKYTSINPLKTIILYCFNFYLLCSYFLIILPLPDKNTVITQSKDMIQLIPFHFIIDFIKETPFQLLNPKTYIETIIDPSFYVVIFNIILFIPLGMFLRYYKKKNIKQIIKISLLLSLFYELTQLSGLYGLYPNPYRLCDIDDLIQNTLGGVLGYWIMKKIEHKLPTKEELEYQALQKGKNISPLRRITLFFLDFILLLMMISFFHKYPAILIFILYFTIIPMVYHNKTLGSAFLKIKIKKTKDTILYYLRPYFIYLYYFILPQIFLKITYQIGINLNNNEQTIILYFTAIIIIFIFYILNIFHLFLHKTIFYDKLFATKLESTTLKESNQ